MDAQRDRRPRSMARVMALVPVVMAVAAGGLLPTERPAGAAGRAAGPLAPAEGVLFGAHVQTPAGVSAEDAVKEVESKLGRTLAIDHYYRPWDKPFPDGREVETMAAGRIPMISWGKTYTAEINAGQHDDDARLRARGVRELGQPVLLRWFWEMGGNRNTAHAGSPEAYIAAWTRLRNIFAEEGATNAVWVWCPDASDFVDGRAQSFYPGDDVVDWTCADGYNFRHPSRRGTQARSFEATFAAFYAWAAERPKPIMVGEYGSVEDAPGDKAAWVAAAREALKTKFPEVAAVVYFHSLRERDGLTYDWRMDSSPESMAAFAAMGADPWFNPTVVRTLPDTVIEAGPVGAVGSADAAFTFSATEAVAGFQCRLDGGPFEDCASPRAYGGLADGRHAFEVRALSADGRPDPTPARWEWSVDTVAPSVVATAPDDGGRAAPDAGVLFTFSEEIDPATLSASAFTLTMEATGMPVTGKLGYDEAARTARFTPDQQLVPLATYRATVAGGVVADGVGNRMAGEHSWAFAVDGPVEMPAPEPPARAP